MAHPQALEIDRAPVRHAFETRADSLHRLADEFGVSMTTLRRWADREGWVRAPKAPSCGSTVSTPPEAADAWRKRLHGRLRRLLERYTGKLEAWMSSPEDLSERSPAEAERYAKTLIALVRCFSDLDDLRVRRDAPAALRAREQGEGEGEIEDMPNFETLITTLECRLDQLASANSAPGSAGGAYP